MSKKRYNWKARQVVDTIVDNSSAKKIKVDFGSEGKYDRSNELVLPSKKRKTKIRKDKTVPTRLLSKKQKKHLQKIVEKSNKKVNRIQLLNELQQAQASTEEISQLTSIATIQTKGLKRYFQEEIFPEKVKSKCEPETVNGCVTTNSISGAKRRKLLQNDEKKESNDPNVVGFESSSSEISDDESDEKTVDKGEVKAEPCLENDTSTIEIKNTQEFKDVEKEVPVKVNDNKNNQKEKLVDTKEKVPIPRKPAVYVDVIRNEDIQAARLKLPILAEEQQIMEIINEHPIIILAGETGSGKTTQVPQFLFEAGYALKKQIAITEPRRVAAISMSNRVAKEMNLSTKEVSYLIRFEGNVTDETKIKFMTDGVLLKEMQTDFLLTKYSVVILDEAHERSVYTDILVGLLSRIVPLRHKKGDPLKLIIMSATLRLEDFTKNQRLFKETPPVIKVEARQFPVTCHFNKRTYENYLKEAFNKAVKINTKLPEGGILIFVTGQQEVNSLVRKLRKAFPLRHKEKILEKNEKLKSSAGEDDLSDNEHIELGMKRALNKKKKIKIIPEINLDDYSIPGDNEIMSDEEFSDIEDDDDDDIDVTMITNAQPLWTIPLYSLLPSYKQQKVFDDPPPGCRLCVVSTNVAETSLTIPNIKYVIDTGKTKVKLYDKVTGVTSYVVTWTSKASSNQRAGRAGRLGPGHCYRLYSSAVFNDEFQDFSVPEIQQKPVDDLYLQMKCMNIDKVVNFPFPTAPDLLQLKTAEFRLETLGALKKGQVTPLGRAISKFPVLPRFGKMLALSHQQDLLPYTICMVAALSVQEVLLEVPIMQISPEERKEIRQKWAATRLKWAGQGNSLLLGDNMVLLRAVGAAEYANSEGKLEKFCTENGLRHKAIVEIRKLRIQLTNEIKKNVPDADVSVDPKLKPPTDLQAKLLRQILLAGLGDQVAKKVSIEEVKEGEDKSKFKYAYHANNMEEPVFLHQGSVLKKTLPEFVIYQEIYETNKMYMRGVTAIEPEWLATYVPSLCNLSEPLMNPEPRYNPATGKVHCTVNGSFGQQAWQLPNIEINYPKSINCYKWFAKFLLEGKVFPKLEKYVKILLSQPNIMIKSWAKLQPRTETILKALLSKDCCTKNNLEEAWKENPQFLLSEYTKWLPESAHAEVGLFWPPLESKKSL
ncbi:probable ATP-dependent RNA helicase kurz [Diorhabda sublineata]|uniref:probable ATP-dependent RNA helicase kurz n=1 Tax=Diorhabda sublineata TaxID=1163346 RepID=UPI0024E07E5D|nr:probable ATP-dependent RNA helicase kurz [Diorhabda sublineata]